jgi:hypothetical protein
LARLAYIFHSRHLEIRLSSYVSLSKIGLWGRKVFPFRFLKQAIVLCVCFGHSNNSIAQHIPTGQEIIARSKKFYKSFSAGNLSIHLSTKSAIAETIQESVIQLRYDKTKNFFANRENNNRYEYFLLDRHYYGIMRTNKTIMDLTPWKKDFIENITRYPFYSPLFFVELEKLTWKVDLSGTCYHLFNLSDHFYFDSTDFSLRRFRQWKYTDYGLEYLEWNIIDQQYYKYSRQELLIPYLEAVKNFDYVQIQPQVKNNLLHQPLIKFIANGRYSTINSGLIDIQYPTTKFILLDIFYQSCFPCIQSFASLKRIESIVPQDSLMVIGIDPVLDDSSSLQKFIKRYDLAHPVIAGMAGKKINQQINSGSIYPLFILIDRKGEIIEVQEGYQENFFAHVIDLFKKLSITPSKYP